MDQVRRHLGAVAAGRDFRKPRADRDHAVATTRSARCRWSGPGTPRPSTTRTSRWPARSPTGPRSAWTTPAATAASTASPWNCSGPCWPRRSPAPADRGRHPLPAGRRDRPGRRRLVRHPRAARRLTLLAMGDVMGHGVEAAVEMSHYRAMLRVVAGEGDPPDRILRRMDVLLAASRAPSARRPACWRSPTRLRGGCWFASAGHLPPAVTRAGGGAALLDVPPGPPLGADLRGRIRDGYVHWRPGRHAAALHRRPGRAARRGHRRLAGPAGRTDPAARGRAAGRGAGPDRPPAGAGRRGGRRGTARGPRPPAARVLRHRAAARRHHRGGRAPPPVPLPATAPVRAGLRRRPVRKRRSQPRSAA